MKNATISDVAKLSGVSKSTVSNYLNGNFERMSDETKKKIKNAIDELGYTPSLSARRLSSKKSQQDSLFSHSQKHFTFKRYHVLPGHILGSWRGSKEI